MRYQTKNLRIAKNPNKAPSSGRILVCSIVAEGKNRSIAFYFFERCSYNSLAINFALYIIDHRRETGTLRSFQPITVLLLLYRHGQHLYYSIYHALTKTCHYDIDFTCRASNGLTVIRYGAPDGPR